MTDVTVYLTICYNLLPSHHFGGLPGRTMVNSLLHLTHHIKAAWHSHKVATIIFLDITNAFPNVITD